MAKVRKAEDKMAQNQIMFDFETEEVKVVKKELKANKKCIKHNHIKKHRTVKKILKGAILYVNRRNKKR